MAKRPDTWMPLYVGDYLRDTGDLTTIEHGAYILLIMQAWTRAGLLPDDDARLRSLTRMDARDWRRSRDTIMGLFCKVDGGYRHKRVDIELAKAKANKDQRRAAGQASAAARDGQRNVNENPTPVDAEAPPAPELLQRTIDETINTPTETAISQLNGQFDDNTQNTVNGRSTGVGVPLQRNLVPSPSPLREEREESANADSCARDLMTELTCEGSGTAPARKRRRAATKDELLAGCDEFMEFYPECKNKGGRGDCEKQWLIARRGGTSKDTILLGLKNFPWDRYSSEYWWAPANWLKAKRWEDGLKSANSVDPVLRAAGVTSQQDLEAFVNSEEGDHFFGRHRQ